MMITSVQLPFGTGDVKASKGVQDQGDFLSVLTQEIKTEMKEAKNSELSGQESDDESPVDEDESIVDTVSKMGVFLNMPLYENESIPHILQIEDLALRNFEMPQIEEIPSETQIGFFLNQQVLEVDETIIPQINGMPSNEIQSMVSEVELEQVSIPDVLDAKQSKDDVPLDNNMDLNIKIEPKKNEYASDIDEKTMEKVEDEGLKLEEHESNETNQSKELKNSMFNNYIHEDMVVKSDMDVSLENQVLSKENIQNIGETIIQLMETTTEGQTSVMKVQLYPEDLGAVNVVLKMDKGKLSTKILVDNDHIRQLFTDKLGEIGKNLFKQNINMDKVEVELNLSTMENPNSYFDSNENSNSNNHEQFKQNHFMDLGFENELNEEASTDRYSDLSSISILA